MLVFWVVTSCGLGRYQRFGGKHCLYLHPYLHTVSILRAEDRSGTFL
jgi:hypothetical protein